MAIRLLLADDHRMVRESLRRSMEDEGFEILGEAADGAAGRGWSGWRLKARLTAAPIVRLAP